MNSRTFAFRASEVPLAPALLTSGSYLGSLAAARDLGRHGIEVSLADTERNTLTACSCYVRRSMESPPTSSAQAWVDWMMDFGAREPGHVMVATSDDICLLLDMHRSQLAPYFLQYETAQGAFRELLDKRRLHEHCRVLGIDQPAQWHPAEVDEGRIRYPVLVKPRSQAGLRASPKGIICENEEALRSALRAAGRTFVYEPHALRHDPEVATPMVQAFHTESEQGVYSLAGFYAPERDCLLLRASHKVLQHPLRVGLGLCFEGREVRQELADDLVRLFDRVGYRGPFEVEFIHLPEDGDRFLLIDVNPRFYGQMGFEISRGLPVARLSHAAACGDWGRFDALASGSRQPEGPQPQQFCDAWMLRLYATTHLMGGNLGLSQWKSWMQWSRASDGADFVEDQDDPSPARQRRRDVVVGAVARPRSTFRRFFVR